MSIRRKKRGYLRYYLLLILVMSAMCTIYYVGKPHIMQMSFFNVKKIIIEGNVNLSTLFLENRVDSFYGRNLFSFQTSDIQIRYENVTRVKDLKVKKIFPQTIEIMITERTAELQIKTADGQLIPMDNELRILDSRASYPLEDVPLVETVCLAAEFTEASIVNDERIMKTLKFHQEIKKVRPELISLISEYYEKNNKLYIIESSHGVRALFTEENLALQIDRFFFVIGDPKIENGMLLNFEFEDQVIAGSEEQ